MFPPSLRAAIASLSVGLSLLAALPLAGQAPEAPDRADAHGDPLPPDAHLRLGTVRLQHGGPVVALAFASDGKTLASAGRDHVARLWDREGKQRGQLPVPWASAVAFSPGGQNLATGNDLGTISLWSAGTGEQQRSLTGHKARVTGLAFSPSGTQLVSTSEDRSVRLWDVATGTQVRELAGHREPVRAVVFAPGGELIATAGQGVRLWQANGETVRSFGEDNVVASLAFDGDGKTLATADEDGRVRLWDPETGKEKAALKGHDGPVASVAFRADGKRLVSSGTDGTVRVWDVATGKEAFRIAGGAGEGYAVALSPDGKVLASAGPTNRVELWDAATGKPLRPDPKRPGTLQALACSADGKLVATGGVDGVLRLWDLPGGKEQRRLAEKATHVFLALSPDGKWLAGGQDDRHVRLWDVKGKEVRLFRNTDDSAPVGATFSPDGKLLAVSCVKDAGKSEVRLHDVGTAKVLHSLAAPAGLLRCTAFSPDGKVLAAALGEGVALWDVGSGKLLREADVRGEAVAFSPDGQVLAAGNSDGVITLLDPATGEAVRHLNGHDGLVHALAFSPDGRTLVSGGNDDAVRLWEVASGQEVRRLAGHAGPVRAVAFLPDGRGVLSGGADGTVLVWDVTGRLAGRLPQAPLSEAQVLRLWDDLISAESSRAYQAIWTLASAPAKSVPVLREQLRSLMGVDVEEIDRLIAQLNHDRFAMRQKASAALARLGRVAQPALTRALAKKPPLEAERRIKALLEQLEKLPFTIEQERLRNLRALEALERGATGEARRLLQDLSRRVSDAELKQAARAALDRLDRLARRSDGK